jgi:hypothetical protein
MERHSRHAEDARALKAAVYRLANPPRNNLPAARPYVWRPGEAQREAEIAARLAAIRARVRSTRQRAC